MPSSVQDMADAYILATVFAYSAAQATHFHISLLLASLASAVLLINSHYLSAPIHPPSTALALLVLLLPMCNSIVSAGMSSLVSALQSTPQFVLEASVGLLLFGWFVHLAILRPLANARESRRSIRPISLPPATQSNSTLLTPAPSSQRSTFNDPTPPQNPLAQHGPKLAQPSSSTSATASPTSKVSSTAAAIAAAARATLQPDSVPSSTHQNPPTASDRAANMRRRRPPTKSQLLATRIMEERANQEMRRKIAMEERQAEIQARSEIAKAERLERERFRRELQEQVRDGAKSVKNAKEALAKAMAEANDGRMKRRRAADQAALIKSEENERLLDEACKESARLEMVEQMALNEVNATQARWTDLQTRLNEFDRS